MFGIKPYYKRIVRIIGIKEINYEYCIIEFRRRFFPDSDYSIQRYMFELYENLIKLYRNIKKLNLSG